MNSQGPVAAALQALQEMLIEHISRMLPDVMVLVGHPSRVPAHRATLNLFVIQVRQTPVVTTFPDRRTAADADILISAHASNERPAEGLAILEWAVRGLSELPGVGSRVPGVPAAGVLLNPARPEELAAIWTALGVSLQPSILCTLRLGAGEGPAT
jgi:hypothetical protein